jgi:hypothetical protein
MGGAPVPFFRSAGANRTGDWVRFFPTLTPPDGTYVATSEGVIAVIHGGNIRWICAEVWFQVLKNPDRALLRLPPEANGKVPAGPPWAPDGTLVRNRAGCVCAIWGGQKRWVPAAVFPIFKAKVVQIHEAAFDGIPSGPPVDADLARSIQRALDAR